MSGMQRRKGQSGEREIAAIIRDLTGWDIRRRVRQHDGDSDLEGVPGWSVEVKRWARADPADIERAWNQAVQQARDGERAVLLLRCDRRDWRAIWGLHDLLCVGPAPDDWHNYRWTAETTVAAWATVAREIAAGAAL